MEDTAMGVHGVADILHSSGEDSEADSTHSEFDTESETSDDHQDGDRYSFCKYDDPDSPHYHLEECVEPAALSASRKNDLKTMQRLIDTDFDDVNEMIDNVTTTCLHEAVKECRFEMVEFLLDNGANLGCIDGEKRGPLHVAIQIENRERRWKMVKLLMNSGVSLAEQNHVYRYRSYNTTCLHEAVRNNDCALVQYFFDAGAEVNCFDNGFYADLGSVARNTPLQIALTLKEEGRHRMVKELLAIGCDAKLCHNGYTCLHTAVAQEVCSWELVKTLLDAGAELNCLSRSNISPLALAAKFNHLSLIEKMIDAGANVNISKRCTNSALELAISKFHKDVVDLLLERGADVNIRDEDGKSILYCAVHEAVSAYTWRHRHEKIEILKAILANGAIMTSSEFGKYDPFETLFEYGDTAAFKIFMRNSFRLEESRVRFPIHAAARFFEKEILQYLLEYHLFDINEKDDEGWTALSLAVQYRKINNVRLLLEYGADVGVVCSMKEHREPFGVAGRTALNMAFANGNSEAGRLLLAAGASEDLGVENQDIRRASSKFWQKNPALDCFTEYLVLLKIQGHPINPANERFLMEVVRDFSEFSDQCRIEIDRLKCTFCNGSTTLYDLLIGKTVVHYTNNPRVKQNFEFLEVAERFPHYGQQIEERFSLRNVRNKLTKLALKIFYRIWRFRICIDEILLNILAQLSMKDLRNLCYLKL